MTSASMKPAGAIVVPKESDFDEIAAVWEASVRATHDFLTEEDIQKFRPLVRDKYLYMVELSCMRNADGTISGFVGVSEDKIEMLFVEPTRFGKGVGRALLLHAVQDKGRHLVDVNEQNEQAVGFYRHMGFEVYDRSEVDSLGMPFPLLHMKLGEVALTS